MYLCRLVFIYFSSKCNRMKWGINVIGSKDKATRGWQNRSASES